MVTGGIMEKDKIEVGEYIRTKKGIIGKLENINEFRPPESKYAVEINEELYFIGDKQLEGTKHSKNIIDLIEVGDFVGKCEIEYITKNENGKTLLMNDNVTLTEKDIHSIVTKEQFKEMEYKV